MALPGVLKVFSGKPVNPVGPDGKMALSDHLRELRARVLRCAVVLIVFVIVGLVFFDPIFDIFYNPYLDAQAQLPEGTTMPTTSGAAAGFLLRLKVAGYAALVLASPYWLYQIWAFLLPGLHDDERKWTRIFVAVASPLFLTGVLAGYWVLPKGLEFLIGLNPEGVTNLVEFNEYLTFFAQVLLAFGIGFEIPLFVVMLNLAGVVKGKTLGQYRHWTILGSFIFAAIITPGDPFTMILMAIPMVLLFGLAEIIARWNDKRRAKQDPWAGLSPDEASTL